MATESKISIDLNEDRFHRLRLIPWWDQERLAAARVLVLGAGALGNEIVKNLALLGVGHVTVVDFDRIEHSNLSRSVLFSAEDEGALKCEAAAAAATRIYPAIHARPLNVDIIYDLGWGWYLEHDAVLTGLDGREARLAANRACVFTRRPFFDGAIEGIDGVVRTFCGWEGPCYECTMSEKDWELIRNRRSCNLLSHDQMKSGHVPTTSTIGSIIAGFQVQQAIKYLHGMDVQAGHGLIINGVSFDAHPVEYSRLSDCFAHDTYESIDREPWQSSATTVGEVLSRAGDLLGGEAILELRHDLVVSRSCPKCSFSDRPLSTLTRLNRGAGLCPECGGPLDLTSEHAISVDSALADRPLCDVGVAEFDIVTCRRGGHFWHAVLAGDDPLGSRAAASAPEGAGHTEDHLL